MNHSPPLALVVDDEPDICDLLAMTLNGMNIETQTCGDVASARRKGRAPVSIS